MYSNQNTPQQQSMPASSPMTSAARRISGPAAAGAAPAMMSGDRRTSMGMGGPAFRPPFDPAMHDLMATRRASMASAGGMEYMSGRPESLETTAILDACIQDLTRRRLSMAMNTPSRDAPAPGGSGMGPLPNSPTSAAALATRQNQLRQQQLEIEQRQKELDIQRQQLLAGMQETHRMTQGAPQPSRPSLAPSPGKGQWWVCQVCNNKAFASHDEAVEHERTCQGANGPTRFPPMPLSMGSPPLMRAGPPPSMRATMADTALYNEANYATTHEPVSLSMSTDKEWLTPLHCFVREHCVEVFCASTADVATPSKGKRKPIHVGQVGIRCPHCHSEDEDGQRERGSVYYPTTISSIYNATMNLLQRHLSSCNAVPTDIMKQYQSLKSEDARSGTSKKYWIESALSLGLVDTPGGIRFLANHAPPSRAVAALGGASDTADKATAVSAPPAQPAPILKELTQGPPLVVMDDKPFATAFSYALLGQMQRCFFTEADRLGKRKGLPIGFAGLACRHCFGGYGSGRFFPSSIKTLSDTSKTLNVLHNHMQRCRKCPQDIKENLDKLRDHHDDERAQMKFGSQKAFFARIWNRLHEGSMLANQAGVKRKAPPMPYMGIPYPPMPPPPMIMAPMNPMLGAGARGMGGLDVLSMQAAASASEDSNRAKRRKTEK